MYIYGKYLLYQFKFFLQFKFFYHLNFLGTLGLAYVADPSTYKMFVCLFVVVVVVIVVIVVIVVVVVVVQGGSLAGGICDKRTQTFNGELKYSY